MTQEKKPLYTDSDLHRASPVSFAREALGVNLWSKQEEVLDALGQGPRVAVKSGNGLGKGFSAAVALLWFLCCHDPAIVLTNGELSLHGCVEAKAGAMATPSSSCQSAN